LINRGSTGVPRNAAADPDGRAGDVRGHRDRGALAELVAVRRPAVSGAAVGVKLTGLGDLRRLRIELKRAPGLGDTVGAAPLRLGDRGEEAVRSRQLRIDACAFSRWARASSYLPSRYASTPA
jgi:hypothetical protein